VRQVISEPSIEAGEIAANRESFARHLRAENLSPKTVYAYCGAVEQFEAFLGSQGMPGSVAALTREHIEAFITHLLETRKPTTAHQRYRGLQAFFKWLVEEGEVKESPMRNMKPPRLPELQVPVLSEDDLRKLLATCASGKGFADRRDHALLRVFIDSGARLAEVTNLRWSPDDPEANDVGLDEGAVRVMGKGRRERLVGLGNKTVKALDRYVRLRIRHPYAETPSLWLGLKGKMRESGVRQVIRRRGRQAGF
jgi:site-specific recombinase XerC